MHLKLNRPKVVCDAPLPAGLFSIYLVLVLIILHVLSRSAILFIVDMSPWSSFLQRELFSILYITYRKCTSIACIVILCNHCCIDMYFQLLNQLHNLILAVITSFTCGPN